jgi:hypothetical protein
MALMAAAWRDVLCGIRAGGWHVSLSEKALGAPHASLQQPRAASAAASVCQEAPGPRRRRDNPSLRGPASAGRVCLSDGGPDALGQRRAGASLGGNCPSCKGAQAAGAGSGWQAVADAQRGTSTPLRGAAATRDSDAGTHRSGAEAQRGSTGAQMDGGSMGSVFGAHLESLGASMDSSKIELDARSQELLLLCSRQAALLRVLDLLESRRIRST